MIDTPQHPEEDEISLLDLLVTLAESWKLLVFGPLLAGILAGGLSFFWPKTFESTSIARLTEEEAALFHAAPVLDPLAEKFGYLAKADGVRDDARIAIKKDLVFSADKKTKLVTLVSKGRTPEQAQALGQAAFGALFVELVPKAKEKEAILQEMAINNQLIEDGVLYVDRSANKNTPTSSNALNTSNATKAQIANLKLNNLELSLKLQSKGREVFAQEPSLPQRKSSPIRSQVVMLVILTTGFTLLLWVFVRRAWDVVAQDTESARKIAAIKLNLGFK